VKKILVIVVAVILLGGGAAAAALFWPRHGGQEAAEKPPERAVVTFEPFVVNLADPGTSHFLRASVQLVVADAETAEHMLKAPVQMAQVRAAILDVLATQASSVVATPAGKTELKKLIVERATAHVGASKVIDVLFTDFVIQY